MYIFIKTLENFILNSYCKDLATNIYQYNILLQGPADIWLSRTKL